jgi:hypothetical protein
MKDACYKIAVRVTQSWDCFSTSKTGSYFLELSRLGLWPLSETLRKCSVETVLGKLSGVKNYTLDTANSFEMKTRCPCNICTADFQADIRIIIAEQRASLKGLCLTCAAVGRTSAAMGNCQAKLWCCGDSSTSARTTTHKCEPPVETA